MSDDWTMEVPTNDSMKRDAIMERLRNIGKAVRQVHTNVVEGDVAEFGTGGGSSFMMIAAVLNALTHITVKYKMAPKVLWGFDSFKGFPQAQLEVDQQTPMVKNGTWGAGQGGSVSAKELFEHASRLLPPFRIKLVEGFYVDSLPKIPAATKFALVHLDCDLYESTFQVLDYLFTNGLLSDGCQLLFDDFLENRASKKMGQRKAWGDCVAKHKVDFTDLGFHSEAGWRCIVHVD